MGKFDAKSDEGIFLGYSNHSKAYRFFNKRTLMVEESINVVFDETNSTLPSRNADFDDVGFELAKSKENDHVKAQSLNDTNVHRNKETNLELNDLIDPEPTNDQNEKAIQNEHSDLPKDWKYHNYHSKENLLANPSEKMMTKA